MSRFRRAQGQRAARAGREAGIDPVCHTLVGAALARGGLARRTGLNTATLLIGANLPDVDVVSYLWGPAADLAFRRGWTHGVLALALWPFALTGAMLAAHGLITGWRRSPPHHPAVPRELLLLSAVSILSHPLLDTLNTYGVRWLMPFSGRWFYGDVLFIVDPWLWLALGLGVLLSGGRRRTSRGHTPRPAWFALLLLAAYTGAMGVSGLAARRRATGELAERTGRPVDAIMLSPLPVTPFTRAMVAAQGNEYRVGRFRWLARPRLDPQPLRSFPRGKPDHPAVDAAVRTKEGMRFLGWARFPTYQVESRAEGDFLVHIMDLRYADRPGVAFGSVSIPISLPEASAYRATSPDPVRKLPRPASGL